MIALAKAKEAEILLSEGLLSHRKIAKAVGISRATVGAIARGERPDYEAQQLAKAEELAPHGPPVRCVTCGGMVYAPCRLCRVRKRIEKEEAALRILRRQARLQAIGQFLTAVRKASLARDAAEQTARESLADQYSASDAR